jgi:hypothetical protein
MFVSEVLNERKRLQQTWPDAFADGLRRGKGEQPRGPRDPGNYPKGFHSWPLDKRNAWFAAFNCLLERRDG